MAAPLNISVCIDDIVSKLILTGRRMPIHIPSMGNKGGAGCNILSLNKSKGEIEVLYLAPGHVPFIVGQSAYNYIAVYFNSLKGTYSNIGIFSKLIYTVKWCKMEGSVQYTFRPFASFNI